jgi:hypothetical protein
MRLLQLFAVSKSTDPRGEVYALIGLSFDAKDNIVVDYTKDLEEVKRDVAVIIAKQCGTLGGLCVASPRSWHIFCLQRWTTSPDYTMPKHRQVTGSIS